MNNILVSGYQDGSDNVMVFSKHINAKVVFTKFREHSRILLRIRCEIQENKAAHRT